MSEADELNDQQLAGLYDYLNRPDPTHEVVNGQNRVMFKGSRAACWDFKRHMGGYVREHLNDD